MFKRDNTFEALRRYQPFADLPDEDLKAIDHLAYITTVQSGRSLIREGRLGQQFIILLDGSADVVRDGTTIAKLVAGDSFGEMSLLEDKPTNAEVHATSTAMIAAFGINEFDEMIRIAPGLARKLMVQLSRRFREASGS